MKVLLSGKANQDLPEVGQSLYPTSEVEVADFREASQVSREYIGRFALGSGNWTGVGGRVFEGKIEVARVAFNGTVWDMDEQLVFDPASGQSLKGWS